MGRERDSFPMHGLFLFLPSCCSFSQASYAPIRATHGYAAAWDGSPSAGADGRYSFPMHGLFLFLPSCFFPCTACFWLYLPVFLSPKRAMRQSVLRTDAQPLGTGRHLLAQMDVILFPCQRYYRHLHKTSGVMPSSINLACNPSKLLPGAP